MKPKKVGTTTTVDTETGEITEVKRNAMTLLPPKGDVCQECATDHAWDQPHNQQSLYYQYYFYSQHARWPNWSDAMAHCPDPVKAIWRQQLIKTLTENNMPIPPDLQDNSEQGATR